MSLWCLCLDQVGRGTGDFCIVFFVQIVLCIVQDSAVLLSALHSAELLRDAADPHQRNQSSRETMSIPVVVRRYLCLETAAVSVLVGTTQDRQ